MDSLFFSCRVILLQIIRFVVSKSGTLMRFLILVSSFTAFLKSEVFSLN